MKKEFSNKWKGSKSPRKQRKYRANAPLNVKRKFLSSLLSKELREKYSTRNVKIRTEDKVKIMRGKFNKKTGKITGVDVKKTKVFVENIERIKRDGSKVSIPINPSNVMITELSLEDKKRKKSIEKHKEKPKGENKNGK